jgi:hypothetical protein
MTMSQPFALALGERFALIGAVSVLLAMPACSSNPGASTNGMGGQIGHVDAGAGGTDARADTRSGVGGYTPPPVVPCTPAIAMKPLLTDFSTGDTFGDGLSMPTGIAEAYGGLTTDTSGGNWHVSGTVMGDSGSTGFFIDFSGCPVDLSRYQGLEFTIGGVVGPNGRIQLQVFTAEDNFVQLANMPPTSDDVVLHNGCLWKTNMYRECVEPSRTITVPSTATAAAPAKLSFTWNQFVAGIPRANPNPALITRIQFLPVTPPATSYDIDVVVDDLALTPFTPDAGTDAPVDAPADTGAGDVSVSDDGGADSAPADAGD